MYKSYSVKGMVCSNCASAIENILGKSNYITRAQVDYDTRTLKVDYKAGEDLSLDKLNLLVEKLGYEIVEKETKNQTLFVVFGIIMVLTILMISRNLGFTVNPVISDNMSFVMLFMAGVLTSFHCIAMCGGIAMTQSIGENSNNNVNTYRAIKYNLGRVVSYTLLGGLIGAIGSIVSVGGNFRGIVSILAGLFMILLSLNLLGVIRIKLPKLSKKPAQLLTSQNGPFLVGLANGFMPCGPLQTMQLYALGTGSVVSGMSAMFFFSLGTVPLMLGLGLFTGALSKNGGRRFIQASSVLVLALGLIMVNRGLVLGGYGVSFSSTQEPDKIPAKSNVLTEASIEIATEVSVEDKSENNESPAVEELPVIPYQVVDGVQVVQMKVMSDRYVLSSPLVVGMPARIELDIQGINRCNSPVLIPKAGVEVDLLRNEPVMEFTPEEVGNLKITCWMGMITTHASIVESLPK